MVIFRYRRRSWFRDLLAKLGAMLILLGRPKKDTIYIVEDYGVFIRRH